MAIYAYDKLNPQRREIRLCTLLSGSFDEPVNCEIEIFSLDDRPEYESLSYAWGAPIFNKEIVIKDGIVRASRVHDSDDETAAGSPLTADSTLAVTTSLYTAFRYLRNSHQTRVIWADAVCINQKDLDERSSQVSIMSDIYKDAKNRQIWLGTVEGIIDFPDENLELDLVFEAECLRFEEFLHSQGILTNLPQLHPVGKVTISPDESVSGALDILRHLFLNKHFYQMPFWHYGENTAGKIHLVGAWYKCLRTFASVISQPWWERIWVVQEVVLSRKAILNIGRHQVLLSSFSSACRNYYTHGNTCCNAWRRLWHGRYDKISLPLFAKMSVVEGLVRVIENHATNRDDPDSLALFSRKRKATDPRDHIYAITGLMKNPVNGHPRGLVPNYHLNPEQLFREQTRSLMQQQISINLLEQAIGIGVPNPLGLPSWVCDWSRPRTTAPEWDLSLYNASNGSEHKYHPATGATLTIAAARVGVVSQLGNLVDPTDAQDWMVKVEQWQYLAGADQVFDIHTVLRATFMDILKSPQYENRRLTPGDLTLIEKWWWQWIARRKRVPERFEDPDLYAIDISFGIQRETDRVYVTREGQLGVGSRTLCVGDHIFIVRGARLPLVLRAIEDNSLEASSSGLCRNYSYVGLCYLHGYMDGEAVTPETEWQTLHLH